MKKLNFKEINDRLDKSWRINSPEYKQKILNLLEKIEKNFSRKSIEKKISIAGTNGKGSIGFFLSDILSKNNIKNVFFNTPYVYDQNEQIIINGKNIKNEEFVNYFYDILKIANLDEKEGFKFFSYFEWWMLIAIYASKINESKYLFLEAGVGGLLDATNFIKKYDMNIFTKISLDHQEILGNNILEISNNKFNLLRENSMVFNYPEQKKEISDNLNKILKTRKSILYEENRDSFYVKKINGQFYAYFGNGVKVKLGNYDNSLVKNIDFSLHILQYFKKYDDISFESIKEEIKYFKPLNRLDIDYKNNVIKSVAHNADSLDDLKKTINKEFPNKKINLILGFLKEKNINKEIKELFLKSKKVFIAPTSDPIGRNLSKNEIVNYVKSLNSDIEVSFFKKDEVTNYIEYVRKISNEPIVVTGSFYIYH